MVGRVLKSMDISVDMADDGLMALEKLKESSPHIILADIRMPNMDGIQLLKQVKKEYNDVDVIIMTAHTSQYSFIDVVECGAVDYITKPFSVEELKAKIERVMRERRTHEELVEKTRKLESAYTEILSLKDDEEKVCREINYEREFLHQELETLKSDNKRLSERLRGLEQKR